MPGTLARPKDVTGDLELETPVLPPLPRTHLTAPCEDAPKGRLTWGSSLAARIGSMDPKVFVVVAGAIALPVLAFGAAAEAAPMVTSTRVDEDLVTHYVFDDTIITVDVDVDMDSDVVALSDSEDSPEEKELKTKLAKYVDDNFDGDYAKAFEHFDGDDSGQLDRSELSSALKKIGVGNVITRGWWVDGLLENVDKKPAGDGNGKISWAELDRFVG